MDQFLQILIIFLSFGASFQSIGGYFEGISEKEISAECLNQLGLLTNDSALLWTMFDASSKYPVSGMAFSNNRDLGNYDQCIDINKEYYLGSVKGKYCGLSLAVINPFETVPDPFQLAINRTNFGRALTLRPKDFKDYSLSFTTLSLCIPDKCTPQEVGKFFVWGNLPPPLIVFTEDIGTKIPCMTKETNTDFKWYDILFIAFLAFILCLIIYSTSYDYLCYKTGRKPKKDIFLAFSFLTNGRKLLHTSTTTNPNSISCLNGIRFISMMWVIAGHGFIAYEQLPLINYAEVKGMIDKVSIQYASAAPIAVDTFFFLSGFLLTYGYLKSAMRFTVLKQILGIPMMIVHRYLRLTPAAAILFLLSVTIFRKLGTGPLWGYVTDDLQDTCKQNWWSYFLYVQNYVNYNKICLNHTWYLSADMQMFILAPLVLIPITVLLRKGRKNETIYALLVLIAICVAFPIGIRFGDEAITNVYDTHSRLNDYLIGVLLGVIMRDERFQKFPFSKLVNLSVWCFVLNCCVAFILYYHNIIRIYNHTSDTIFYGLYRPVWGFSLAWMIYSCYHGYGGLINWLLSLPAFQIGARLSYCMYLLHALVEMYYVGLVRTQHYWSDYNVFYIWCGHFVLTMVLSLIWSLAFESPMITIEKFIFGRQSKPKQATV